MGKLIAIIEFCYVFLSSLGAQDPECFPSFMPSIGVESCLGWKIVEGTRIGNELSESI